MYACPTMLSPERIIRALAVDLKKAGAKPIHRRPRPTALPERDYRRSPVPALVERFELGGYEAEAPLVDAPLETGSVRIPLKQHVGVPCVPAVKEGDRVKVGDLIADVPAGALRAAPREHHRRRLRGRPRRARTARLTGGSPDPSATTPSPLFSPQPRS